MRGSALPVESSPNEEADLWRSMREDGSAQARDRLFSDYLPFARSLARRHFRTLDASDIELNDLFQLAFAGLLEAMDRFDPGLGVPFRGFASRRINGSIIDGISRMSEVREQIGFRQRAKRERLRSLAARDTESGTSSNAVEALVDLAVGLAIGFMLEGTGLFRDEEAIETTANAYDGLAWKQVVQRVVGELSRLPEREGTIIRLHYLEEVNFDQIAILLGLSKGRISQLHKTALILLRKRLSKNAAFHLER